MLKTLYVVHSKSGTNKKLGDYHHNVQHNSCLTTQSLLEVFFLFRFEILLTDFFHEINKKEKYCYRALAKRVR